MTKRKRLPRYAAIAGLGLLFCNPAWPVDVVNQRDVGYQQSLSRLVEASQALDRALDLVRESQTGTPLANVDYRRLLGDLAAIRAELNKLIMPHERTEKYRPLIPDASYVVTPAVGEGRSK